MTVWVALQALLCEFFMSVCFHAVILPVHSFAIIDVMVSYFRLLWSACITFALLQHAAGKGNMPGMPHSQAHDYRAA